MNFGLKSRPITTQQTRFSEDIFNSGLKTIRKRINVLSKSSVFTPNRPYPTYITDSNNSQASGMLAKVSKMVFDAEMLEQDVKSQVYQLHKTKQYMAIVAHQINRNNNRLQSHLAAKLTTLEQQMAQATHQTRQNTKNLIFQIQQKRRNSMQLRQQLSQLGRRVKKLEDALGFYTAHQKLQTT